MAIVTTDDAGVTKRSDGMIVLQVPIAGRDRKIVLKPEDAVRIGTRLVNAGADLLDDFSGIPRVSNVLMRPFDKDGLAMLRIATEGSGGELLLTIDAKWMIALSEVCTAALASSGDLGRA